MNYSFKNTQQRDDKLTSPRTRISHKILVYIYRILFLGAFVAFFAGGSIAYGVIHSLVDTAPSIEAINVVPNGYATTVYNNTGNAIQTLVGKDANREYVILDQIPTDLRSAFVAIEDERFWSHQGIDAQGILRAFFTGLSGGDFNQGASTLTQQLLKNQVFNGGQETTFVSKLRRKVQEQYLSIQLERRLTKEQIMEYYLNTINLGQNTLGVQAASKRYFNKSVAELSLSEAAVLAGITQNPSAYNPITHPAANSKKRLTVLTYMKDQGYITTKNYEDALADDVYGRIELVNEEKSKNDQTITSYFTDAMIDQVLKDMKEKLGYTETQAYNALYRGGLKIYTTQDASMQSTCDKIINDPKYYPADSTKQLSYQLSVKHSDGTESHYSQQDMESYFARKNIPFSIYYTDTKQATPYIERFKEAKTKGKDVISGEVKSFLIQPQTSFVLMDQKTGYVKALSGGRGSKTGSRTYNRATESYRQPGSTFKILSTYLPALDTSGMTLASVQDDTKYYYPGTKRLVKNWYKTGYRGLTSMREAIYNSMNIIAVKTLEQVTPKIGYDYLLNLGFTSLVENMTDSKGNSYTDIALPMALGGLTKGVSNLELTNAFATIANNGVYNNASFYTKIIDHNGNVLLENEPTAKQVMKDSTAWLLTSAMKDVIKIGSGKLLQWKKIKMPVAGKTGTTSSNKDLWFVGYTPYLTAGIWGGYDQNKTQSSTTYHKEIWRTIMEKINKGFDKTNFIRPDSIVSAKICTKCGKLAVSGLCNVAEGGSCVKKEYFAVGSVPTENCDCHVKCNICTDSNRLANERCPADKIITRVYLQKKEEATTDDSSLILPSKLNGILCGKHK